MWSLPLKKKIRSRYFLLSYMPVFLTSSLAASPLSCPFQNYNYTVPLTLGPSSPCLLPQDFLYTRVPTWTLPFPWIDYFSHLQNIPITLQSNLSFRQTPMSFIIYPLWFKITQIKGLVIWHHPQYSEIFPRSKAEFCYTALCLLNSVQSMPVAYDSYLSPWSCSVICIPLWVFCVSEVELGFVLRRYCFC